jgi:hypothetical protein
MSASRRFAVSRSSAVRSLALSLSSSATHRLRPRRRRRRVTHGSARDGGEAGATRAFCVTSTVALVAPAGDGVTHSLCACWSLSRGN